jgi:hypothetical protein
VITDFARVLREQIRKDMNNYADDLAGGACRSFEEYQKLCGVIQGLALSESYLLALLEKVEKSDD